MIAYVRGTVADVGLVSAVIEVGGIGLEVRCAPNTLAELRTGAQAKLPTSLVVREDSLTLFGFADDDELAMFDLLQSASGVGPKLAQAILACHDPEALRRAVAADDVKTLTAVPGIGTKGAQRIIIELKDRIGAPGAPSAGAPRPAAAWESQVQAGLVGLGWSAKDADRAIATVAPDAGPDPDVAALLRAALRTLSRS
jgi:Holliday junction DNA helicase RuvA